MSSIKSGALRHSAAATAALFLKRISQSQLYIVTLQSTFSADRLLKNSFFHLSPVNCSAIRPTGRGRLWQKFSKVSSVVIVYGKFSSEPTFENL